MFELFDISPCKCKESANFALCFCNGKYACTCPLELRNPEKEFEFLKDQRSGWKMIIQGGSHSSKATRCNIIKKEKSFETTKKKRGRPRKDESASTKQQITAPDNEYSVLLETEHQDEDFFCAINSASFLKKLIGNTGQIVTKTK